MLILDKNKVNLLLENGFKKETREDGSDYYVFNKSFYIEGYLGNNFNCGKIIMRNPSLANLDILYKLIKDNIIIYIENPKNSRNPYELKNKIKAES